MFERNRVGSQFIKKTAIWKASHQKDMACQLELTKLAQVQQCEDVFFQLDYFVHGYEDMDDKTESHFVKEIQQMDEIHLPNQFEHILWTCLMIFQ